MQYVQRFIPLIQPAVDNIVRKVGKRALYWGLAGHLRQRLLDYAGPRKLKDSDAGMLDSWEDDCAGDPDKLDAYVQQALNCDALDYMRRQLRRENASLDDLMDAMEPGSGLAVTDAERQSVMRAGMPKASDIDLRDYPLLTLHYVEGYSQAEIAEKLGVSIDTVQRRMQREREALVSRGTITISEALSA